MQVVTKPENFDTKAFAERADLIYKERYQEEYEKLYKGKFAAIEVDSGDCFGGDSKLEAAQKAKQKYPDQFFYFIRIGYPWVSKRR